MKKGEGHVVWAYVKQMIPFTCKPQLCLSCYRKNPTVCL
jgi:hypothetical protein